MAGRGFGGGGGGGRAVRGKGKAGGPVVCVGEALVDCISRQPAAAVAAVPEGGWEPQPGGAPANVAAGVAKLGHAAAFVGGLGRDAAGERLTAELEAQVRRPRAERWRKRNRPFSARRVLTADRG